MTAELERKYIEFEYLEELLWMRHQVILPFKPDMDIDTYCDLLKNEIEKREKT